MQSILRFACCLIVFCFALLGGAYADEEKNYWNYDRAAQGVLGYEIKFKDSPYPMRQLDLACLKGGDLYVEARRLTLWVDVSGYHIDTKDLDRLAIETSMLRIETEMVPINRGFSGWASGTFKDSVKLVAGVVGTEFLVIRAINRKPVAERPLEYSDITLKIEPPNWEQVQPFLEYCATIQPSLPRF